MTPDQFNKAISQFNEGIDGYFAKLYLIGGHTIQGGLWELEGDMVRIDINGVPETFAFVPISSIVAISAEA